MDLKIERTGSGEDTGDWLRIGEVLHREFNARARGMVLFVEGRKIYEMMEDYWPKARTDESQPDYMREYGEIWTSMPKVLVSHTRTSAEHDTRIVTDDAIEQLATIRAETDGDIGVGGATLATQLLHNGLLDELLLFTHPVILGSGRPLFDEVPATVQLDLIEQAAFPDGVTLHRYAVRNG